MFDLSSFCIAWWRTVPGTGFRCEVLRPAARLGQGHGGGSAHHTDDATAPQGYRREPQRLLPSPTQTNTTVAQRIWTRSPGAKATAKCQSTGAAVRFGTKLYIGWAASTLGYVEWDAVAITRRTIDTRDRLINGGSYLGMCWLQVGVIWPFSQVPALWVFSIEHDSLHGKLQDTGRYENAGPAHRSNSNTIIANVFLFQQRCHSTSRATENAPPSWVRCAAPMDDAHRGNPWASGELATLTVNEDSGTRGAQAVFAYGVGVRRCSRHGCWLFTDEDGLTFLDERR